MQGIDGFMTLAKGPNNEPLIFGLIIALFGVLVGHCISLWQYKARLKDKDERIKDLVEQRNQFQEIVLQSKGIKRKSSKE